MSEQTKPPLSFWEELRTEILEVVKPQNLVLYGIAVIIFTAVSLILSYEVQVYSSIMAGIVVFLVDHQALKVNPKLVYFVLQKECGRLPESGYSC